MNKYALIVDPFSSGVLYAEALRKRGITPVAVISHTPIVSAFKDSFRETDYEHSYTYHRNDEALFKSLANFLKKSKPIFVLPGAETGIELADKLADYFCPELSNGSQLSSSRRNKFDMAQRLLKNNVAAPATIKSSVIEDVLSWANQLKLLPSGVVIKPLNSAGTDGVIACFSESEIELAMNNSLGKINQFNYRNESILAQEFVTGTEYVVDTASFSGKHTITNICCYKKTNANGSRFVYDYLDFLPETGSIQLELAEYAFQVLNCLGIKYGPAHSEIMYTSRGPLLIETGARLHGGVAIPAARLATGSSHLDHTLDFFLTNTKLSSNQMGFKLKNYTRIVFLISYFENNVIGEHVNLEVIKQLTSFAILKLIAKPDTLIKKTVDLFSIPGLLILSHESSDQVENDYQMIRKLEKDGLFILDKKNN